MSFRFSSGSLVPRRAFLEALAFVPFAPAVMRGASALGSSEQETFLREATIISMTQLAQGVTKSRRATLQLDGFTHDAHIQSIDEYKRSARFLKRTEINFRDSYRFNVAAYRVSELLGLGLVPVSVKRNVGGQPAAVTWWIDDVLMSEQTRLEKRIPAPDWVSWRRQRDRVRLFHELVYNTDPNPGNAVIDRSWKVWLIDFTRAFRFHRKLRRPHFLQQIDGEMLEAVRRFSIADLKTATVDVLFKDEQRGLLARRKLIVERFGELAAQNPASVYG